MERRSLAAYVARNKVIELDFTFADFAALAATNGLAATLNIGGLLPPGAVIDSYAVLVAAYFTGGGASAVTLQVGVAGSLGDLFSAHNLFAVTTLNKWLQGATPGVQAVGPAFGGLQLVATVTPDGGHQLKLLTAGSAKIVVYFSVPDASNFA